jgi:hypothetical protein
MPEMGRLYQREASYQAVPSFFLVALLAFLVMFLGGSILAAPQPRRSGEG